MKITHAISVAHSEGENMRIATLLSGLSERFDIELIAPSGSVLFSMLSGTRVKQTPINSEGRSSFSLTDVYKMERAMRRDKPDAVHSHASLSARAAAKMCGVRGLVCERTGGGLATRPGSLFSSLYNVLTEITVSSADSVTRQLISEGVPEYKIVRLGCGAPELTTSEGDGEPTVVAKCLGEEECRLVVSASARAAARHSFKTLVFVPEEILRAARRDAALFSCSGKIEFLPVRCLSGYTPTKKTLFVYPVLRDERLPVLPMRFMSASLPLAVSATPRNRDFFREGREALFFIPGDPFSLSECILRIISDEGLWHRLALGAREGWESRYNTEKMLEEYGGFYISLLSSLGS